MAHTHCLSPARIGARAATSLSPASYGRMFPDLPTFNADESFLYALGRAGGLCDCGSEGDADASLGSEAAGWPFFGQFVAHDITADRSALRSHVDPSRLRNARSPQLNLECLYGDGPVGHPFLYQRADPAKLLTGAGGLDLLRNAEGTAIIGDPRNDSHLLVSQMHLAFVHAHNACVDRARAAGIPEDAVFESAARELRWNYQEAVVAEFLPTLIGFDMIDSIRREGRRFYRPSRDTFIPLEFADAAYRYGHSQIRQRYTINDEVQPVPILPDLMGFRPVTAQWQVDWRLFFDVEGHPPAQRAKRIDGRLVSALIALPVAMTGATSVDEFHSLAVRDLERGQGVGLPSGEAVAAVMGEEPLTPDEVGANRAGWAGETPLWFYILREAAVRCDGNQLGPIGGRIVGEVLLGILETDPDSVLHAPEDWQPAASLVDLLTGVGMHEAPQLIVSSPRHGV
jgi:heme peroxidase